MKRYLRNSALTLLAALAAAATSCDKLDTSRIPSTAVRVVFTTVGDWDTYGVPGALDTRRFIKADRVPANFPYTALTYTGFGGVLLVGDINGDPRAYDLACPVECKYNVRIEVDTETNTARCPKCGSRYDIFTNYGHPLSGEAAVEGYGLRVYRVGVGSQGEYMVISQ